MLMKYELRIKSTGELVATGFTDRSFLVWERRIIKKLLRYKSTPERRKVALLAGDYETGWANYDEFIRAGVRGDELQAVINRVLKGQQPYQ